MMPAGILSSDSPPFDRVELTVEGELQIYAYEEFMGLPLAQRIQLILAASPRFFLGEDEVEKKKALALG